MILRLIRFWSFIPYGLLIISVSGENGEVFVANCAKFGIRLKYILRRDGALQCRIFAPDLVYARKLGLTRGYRIRIISRTGAIRFLLPLWRRPVFWCGAVLCCVFLGFMSGYIWQVDILSDGINNRLLYRELESLGITPGVHKDSVDNEHIKNSVLLSDDRLGWFAVNLSGCTARVSYSLKRLQPELIAIEEPCDVVATKPGVIKLVNTYSGTPCVTSGQTVMPGDVLISSKLGIGSNRSDEITYRYVHARGEVWGRTWYDLTAYSPEEAREKVFTGKIKRKVYLKIGNRRINLGFGYGNHGGDCDIILKDYALGFNAFLCIEENRLFMSDGILLPESEEDRLSEGLTAVLCLSMDSGRISAFEVGPVLAEDAYCVRLNAECVEQIGACRVLSANDSGS